MTTNPVSGKPRIVVGVDGSPSSIQALKWARRMAGAIGADIEALTTWEYPSSYGLGAVPDNWQPDVDAAAQLTAAVAAVFGTPQPEGVTMSSGEGHAAPLLVEASEGAEMLVVGSRGHGGFVGLLLGSVSAYCAEHASCPVVVVHDKPATSDKTEIGDTVGTN